jgi:uncharacterized RDD family membrane protein YckC
MQAAYQLGSLDGLPDPELDPQFYEGVLSRRLVAWVVDVMLILAVGVPLAIVFGLATLGLGFAVFPLIVAGTGFLYRTITIAGGSATWGMRLVGIELRRHDGSRFDFVTALLHTTLYTVAMGMVLVQMASVIAMLGTRHGQGLPDLVLRTTAINPPAD